VDLISPKEIKDGRVKYFKGNTTSSPVSFRETESTPPSKGGEFKRQVNIMIIPIIEIQPTNNLKSKTTFTIHPSQNKTHQPVCQFEYAVYRQSYEL
jgi:hypothetical protein